MTTGEKIASLRRAMGLSQEALADKLGLSRQAVSKWEADQAVPGMENLVELSKLFGVPVDTLLRPDEPLPGKSEQEEPPVMQPTGYTISYKPQLTKKTKWFVWGLSALIAASVLCSIFSLVWLDKLQKQVDSIPTGMNTVYVPGPESAQQSDFTSIDNDVRYDGENLQFTCNAMPREAGGTAWFVLQGNGTTQEVQAEEANGVFQASLTAPPAPTYTLILRLEQDDKTRNLEVQTFYYLDELYELGQTWVSAPLSWSGGKLAAFTVTVDVQPSGYDYPDAESVVPVSGRAVLYIAGQAVETQELKITEDAPPIWHNEDGAVPFTEGSTQLCADFSAHECPDIDLAEVRVTLTDNFGREHQYSSNG